MLSVLMILLAEALPQRGAFRHIIRTAPLRPPAPSADRARPAMVPKPRRTGPRFLKDARFMAAFTGQPADMRRVRDCAIAAAIC
jgi:hypothetical protein